MTVKAIHPRWTVNAAVVALIAASVPAVGYAQSSETQVKITGANFSASADFFIPPTTAPVLQAVIVIVAQGPSWIAFRDTAWRSMCQRLACALLHLELDGPGGPTVPIATDVRQNAASGSGEALLRLLDTLAARTHRPELRHTNLVFWGYSASADFGWTFAAWRPDRTVGFVNFLFDFGAVMRRGLVVNRVALRTVPGLILRGSDEDSAQIARTRLFWRAERGEGALWSFAVLPGQAHWSPRWNPDTAKPTMDEPGNVLTLRWIEAVLRLRAANPVGATPEAGGPRPIREDAGWLGDEVTRAIAPFRAFSGTRTHASWLPDSITAGLWAGLNRATPR